MKGNLTVARVAAGMLAGAVLAPSLPAQSRLYVLEPDGGYHVVFAVRDDQPWIRAEGRLVAARGQRMALRKVDEYLPLLVDVTDQMAGTTYLEPVGISPTLPQRINNEFRYSATFESSCALDDVFLVLEIEFANADRRFFAHEIGRLEAWQPRRVTATAFLEEAPGGGRFLLHVFAGGAEVLHSGMPAEAREATLDAMVARRIKGVPEGEPRLLFGVAPRYPAVLRETALRGNAVVALRVSARGVVLDPAVEEASDPAFGEAALAAVRQWRFVPRVTGGRAVEAGVRVPVAFALGEPAPAAN